MQLLRKTIRSVKLKLGTIKTSRIKEITHLAPVDPVNDAASSNSSRLVSAHADVTGRRLQDAPDTKATEQTIDLDRRARHSERRAKQSDRRINTGASYNGPARRYTIDRRLNLSDRRNNGE